MMLLRKYAPWAALALPVLALYLVWLWQPERQVRLHTTSFLKKVERRNWDAVRAALADDYADRWEHDKGSAVGDAREVFRQFLFLKIENRIASVTVVDGRGEARATVKIGGRGGPLAELVMERVNGLREPFVFTWRRGTGGPWNWQLVAIDHPSLNAARGSGF